jgi:transposase
MMTRDELMQLDKEVLVDLLLAAFAEIAALKEIVAQQAARITELENRLNKNSKNSSKPPSSDGYRKPEPKSQRKPSGHSPGGQPGHKGHGLELPKKVDEVRSIMQSTCWNCSHELHGTSGEVIDSRYVLDIPPIVAHVTRLDRVRTICPECGLSNDGIYPEGVNSTIQYGTNVKSLAVTLLEYGMVSIERTREILSGVFGMNISAGTIQSMVYECAEKASPIVDEEIKEAVINSPTVGFDETSFNVNGKLHWLHTASTGSLTYITLHPRRGIEGIEAGGVLPSFTGNAIHDCFSPYFQYTTCLHALCNAHLIRELTAVYEQTKQDWATNMIELLVDMKNLVEEHKPLGMTGLPDDVIAQLSKEYDDIINDGLALNPLPERKEAQVGRLKRGKVRCLLDRFNLYRDMILRFASDFNVPWDNNQAERDFRINKVKQKVSGGARSLTGAKAFATITSFIQTVRKHGLSVFNVLRLLFSGDFSLQAIASVGATE